MINSRVQIAGSERTSNLAIEGLPREQHEYVLEVRWSSRQTAPGVEQLRCRVLHSQYRNAQPGTTRLQASTGGLGCAPGARVLLTLEGLFFEAGLESAAAASVALTACTRT